MLIYKIKIIVIGRIRYVIKIGLKTVDRLDVYVLLDVTIYLVNHNHSQKIDFLIHYICSVY